MQFHMVVDNRLPKLNLAWGLQRPERKNVLALEMSANLSYYNVSSLKSGHVYVSSLNQPKKCPNDVILDTTSSIQSTDMIEDTESS